MVEQVMALLAPRLGEVVADCTVGCGGHAEEFCRRIGPTGRLIGFDLDGGQLETARQRLPGLGVPVSLHHGNFAALGNVLAAEGLDGYDVIFADLGVSSAQVDDPSRGLSYKHDGPLDMRLGERVRLTAADLLAELPERELAAMLSDLGDESDAAAIAARIVQARQAGPITRTAQLVALILQAKGLAHGRGGKQTDGPGGLHPAARTFQALRIRVNNELENLAQLLRLAPYCLRAGGRIGVISFHSGEDRLVKHAFRDGLRAAAYAAVADEVIRPTGEEVRSNPRSSPARFRWARRPPA
jgi:16S rRNA (cytosine1402-N4)-methyltransferase